MGGIGTSAKRLEDPPLLMGKGLFVADINHDNQIYMRVVRSDVSHGKMKRDLEKCGVLEEFTRFTQVVHPDYGYVNCEIGLHRIFNVLVGMISNNFLLGLCIYFL